MHRADKQTAFGPSGDDGGAGVAAAGETGPRRQVEVVARRLLAVTLDAGIAQQRPDASLEELLVRLTVARLRRGRDEKKQREDKGSHRRNCKPYQPRAPARGTEHSVLSTPYPSL